MTGFSRVCFEMKGFGRVCVESLLLEKQLCKADSSGLSAEFSNRKLACIVLVINNIFSYSKHLIL